MKFCDLFFLQGKDFIFASYRNILNREPTASEVDHQLSRIRSTATKLDIVFDIAMKRKVDSPVKSTGEVGDNQLHFENALTRFIKAERRARGPFGWFFPANQLNLSINFLEWAIGREFAATPSDSSSIAPHKLFRCHDEAFITEAYKIFLGREADSGGLEYYRTQLWEGRGKTAVIHALARSNEATFNHLHQNNTPSEKVSNPRTRPKQLAADYLETIPFKPRRFITRRVQRSLVKQIEQLIQLVASSSAEHIEESRGAESIFNLPEHHDLSERAIEIHRVLASKLRATRKNIDRSPATQK